MLWLKERGAVKGDYCCFIDGRLQPGEAKFLVKVIQELWADIDSLSGAFNPRLFLLFQSFLNVACRWHKVFPAEETLPEREGAQLQKASSGHSLTNGAAADFSSISLVSPSLSSFVALPCRLTPILLLGRLFSSSLESWVRQPLQSQRNVSPGWRVAVDFKQGFLSQQIA